jgi:hypothetical protein
LRPSPGGPAWPAARHPAPPPAVRGRPGFHLRRPWCAPPAARPLVLGRDTAPRPGPAPRLPRGTLRRQQIPGRQRVAGPPATVMRQALGPPPQA